MRSLRILAATLLALALAGPSYAGGIEEGAKALKEGRFAAASEAYRAVLKASPSNRDALLGLARAVADGRIADAYDEIQGLLSAALRAKADDREARIALGNLYLARAIDDPRYRADVQDQFTRLQKADPLDEEAAVGLARMYYAGADYARGRQVLEDLLAKKPAAALALYWKGTLVYDEAVQALGKDSQMTPAVRALFEQALSAFDASTKADGTRYDAWVKLAYAAQYLVRVDESKTAVAKAAYLRALDLDGENDASLRGLTQLYANDRDVWRTELQKLATDRPKAPIVQFYWGYALEADGKFDQAEKAYRQFVAVARAPAMGWFQLGELLREKKSDVAGAGKAYMESLKASTTSTRAQSAVYWLLQPLNERARDDVAEASKAKALLKEYDAIITLSPKNISARNDAGFVMREAYGRTKDRSLLSAAVERYESASELIGEWRPEYETSVPYRERHGFAQVLNDTGLMFQYYPETRDLKKAESYYVRALEWTSNGYWDAYGNLMKILEPAGRIEEAKDLAEACAEGIKQENGEPQETFRGTCRGDAERLAKKLAK